MHTFVYPSLPRSDNRTVTFLDLRSNMIFLNPKGPDRNKTAIRGVESYLQHLIHTFVIFLRATSVATTKKKDDLTKSLKRSPRFWVRKIFQNRDTLC